MGTPRDVKSNKDYRHQLSHGVRSLLSVGLTAPVVGLLDGALVPVFSTCSAGWALTGNGSIGAVSAGIAQSLVPFVFGLAVGLLSIWAWAFLRSRVERVSLAMARAAELASASDRELLQ